MSEQPPLQPWDSRKNALGTPPVEPAKYNAAEDAVLRVVLPIGQSGWAIAAGYLGLFSVLGIFAPFALLTGILALRDIAEHPKKHGKARAIFGIIMGVLGTALLLFVLYLFLFEKQK